MQVTRNGTSCARACIHRTSNSHTSARQQKLMCHYFGQTTFSMQAAPPHGSGLMGRNIPTFEHEGTYIKQHTFNALNSETQSHQVNNKHGLQSHCHQMITLSATQTPVNSNETYHRHLSCLSTLQPADRACFKAVPLVAGPLPKPAHRALWLNRKRLQDWAHDKQTWKICG